MKKPKIGDFIFTNEDAGIVKRIGIDVIEYDNNVNICRCKFDEVQDVI